MTARSYRIYVVPHGEGDRRRLTGILMRRWDQLFDGKLPSFSARDEAELRVKAQRTLAELSAEGVDLERYTFEGPLEVRETSVDVHPLFTVKKQPVIGKATVPLRLSYACRKLEAGGYQVLLPRFGGWFLVEELSLAADVLRHAVASWMVGQDAKWLYDFRYEGTEWVVELAAAPTETREDADDDDERLFPTTCRVAENLAVRAKKGRLPQPMGESAELAAILALPPQSPPRSLLLVGPPGVGKTALVRRLARAWSRKDTKGVRHPRLWSTSAERLLAGMVYLGMWQERMLEIVGELDGEGDYLYVGSLPGILEPQPDGASIGEMLEPAVAAEQISLLAECSAEELEHARRKHPSLVARFDVVRVEEPPYPRTLELLVRYADRKGLELHPTAARRLHQLLSTFVPGTAFPGKGTRFLDALGTTDDRSETAKRRTLYPRDVVAAFSKATGLPERLVSDDVSVTKEALAKELAARVVGQETACFAAARVLVRFKAGLADRERPAGTLLFVGPTGVGKTELAKELARTMFGGVHRMVRIDMGEYGAAGASRRLLDASPGSTSLARRVAAEPLTLVLLDEIEKAHPEVFDLLLGVLGEGRLTDTRGRFVDFRSTVIVMTSNLGVSNRAPVGFADEGGDEKDRAHDFVRAVREHFRPELFPRIDEVVPFRGLGPGELARIVDLELDALRARPGLLKRGLTLEVTPAAKRRLAELGHHPLYGARPLRRVLEERITAPVAGLLAGDGAAKDGRVVVAADGEAVDGGWVVRVG